MQIHNFLHRKWHIPGSAFDPRIDERHAKGVHKVTNIINATHYTYNDLFNSGLESD